MFNDSYPINKENTEKIYNNLSIYEAITEEFYFNYNENISPYKYFSKRLKQQKKITKYNAHHSHNKYLPKHLVVLSHHHRLHGKVHNKFLKKVRDLFVLTHNTNLKNKITKVLVVF